MSWLVGGLASSTPPAAALGLESPWAKYLSWSRRVYGKIDADSTSTARTADVRKGTPCAKLFLGRGCKHVPPRCTFPLILWPGIVIGIAPQGGGCADEGGANPRARGD